MHLNRRNAYLATVLWFSSAVSAVAVEPFVLWTPGQPVPKAADVPLAAGVEIHTIAQAGPDVWMKGVHMGWHKDRLYASFGYNDKVRTQGENSPGEQARVCVSEDGGRTWSKMQTIAVGEGDVGISHGVFLSHDGRLWSFHGAFHGKRSNVHTRAFQLNETTGVWEALGTVIDGGFWPLQEPLKMDDGNWIMAGVRLGDGNPAAVVISRGDDLMTWDLVVIPKAAGRMWGESSVLLDGKHILNIARYGSQAVALAAVSEDYGRTWTPSRPSNLPMTTSRPFAGTLSTGQRYLICTTTADSGTRRQPLTIAVAQPGEMRFGRILGLYAPQRSASLNYPGAVERDGRLYVGFTEAYTPKVAVVPVVSLTAHDPVNIQSGREAPPTISPSVVISEPAEPFAQRETTSGGRIGAWSFEDLRDGVVRDTAGNLNGRIQGTPELVQGVVGRAIRLNGRTDFVTIPHTDNLAFTEATFSICAWVNVYALNRGQQMIAAKNVYSAGQREWGLMLDNDNRFRFYLHQGGWQTVSSKTSPTPGRWYHLAVTMDAGYGRLYVDGRLEGEGLLGRAVPRTAAPLTFGGVDDGGQRRQMLFGALDEISLDRAVLTPATVQTLANKDTVSHPVPESPEPYGLWAGGSLPKSADLPLLEAVRFQIIKRYEPRADGYRFLHGVALAWHEGKLYASFGHNKGSENTGTEEARGRVSTDGGKTWGDVFTIDSGQGNLGISHGVFLSHEGTLWAFQGAFYNSMERIHTRAYVLDEATGQWQAKGVVVDGGFWPMQEPLRMQDGNWIMSGFGGGLPGVAISHGDDLTKWDLVVIPKDPSVGSIWGESTVILEGNRMINVSRYGEQAVALVAVSGDYGRTWTPSRPSNLPMATSKPYTGTLSTGQHYLICTTTADSGGRRHPLTIAVTRPGETQFRRVFLIRGAEHEGLGESHPGAALAYPYAVEHDGNLYVGYSNSGGGVGREGTGRELWNNNSAELAIIPVAALAIRDSP